MAKTLTSHFTIYILLSAMALSGCAWPVGFYSLISPKKETKKNIEATAVKDEKSDKTSESDPAPSTNSCDIRHTQYNPETMKAQAKPREITIERQFQRKIVKNCTGDVTFDGLVTVKAPHYDLELKAPVRKTFQSVFVFNDATCDHKLTDMPVSNPLVFGLLYAVTGDGNSRIKIKGDMAQATFTFHLREGQNDIYVHYFYDCSPADVPGNIHVIVGRSNCTESHSSLIVQYPIFVNYKETTLDGVIEEIPSVEKCQEQSRTAEKATP